jgi:lambda family phage portal protein
MSTPKIGASPLKGNLLDRALAYVAPARALERHRARIALAASGAWAGARFDRAALQRWWAPDGSADVNLLGDLPTLRKRSRDLARNAPIAVGALATVCTNVVGTGLVPLPRVDRAALGLGEAEADAWENEAKRIWSLWADSAECDAARTHRFVELQELVLRSTLENGDAFAIRRNFVRAGSPLALKVQLVEADRVCNPSNRPDDALLRGGIARDSNGAPVAVHVADRHPADFAGPAIKWQEVSVFGDQTGRRRVFHLYRALRIDQGRGVPYLAPVVETLKQLSRYSDAEVMAAVLNACFAIVTKTEGADGLGAATGDASDTKGDPLSLIDAGQIVDLAPNESIEGFTPARPSAQFDAFMQSLLRQVGMALELPFEVLVKHFTASYSAARAALLEAWKFFRARRAWLARSFCQPLYEEVLIEAVARGWLAAPGFFDDPRAFKAWTGAVWVGPPPGQIDPGKEADAAATMVAHGWKTDAEVTAELTGGDWEVNAAQRKKEIAIARDAGFPPPSPTGQAAPLPAPQSAPNPDGPDTEKA